MDKEEFRAKQEEINRLVDQKDYAGAMAVVDTIDWRRVKSGRTLSIVAEIYAANKRYEDSIDMYLLAYNRSRVGTNILSRLIEISLKAGNIEEAEEFYEEFRDVAPNNHASYVLKYKILKAKQAPIEQQIAVLDEYKEKEFTERWAYELALLYYKSEKKEECLDLCDTLILWFSEGPYVLKALDLKERLGVLEGSQKEQYEKAFTRALLTSEDREMLGEEAECEGKELQVTQQEDSEAEAQYDFEEEKQITEHSKESTSVETSLEDEISEELDSGELQEQKKNTPKGFQERLTKGFQDIFGKRDRETEKEDLFADDLLEEDLSQETLNVMHHDDVEEQNIPMLEPENLTGEEEPEFVDVESEQVRVEEGELRKPEEKSLFDSDVIQQIMEEKKQNQENATTTADGFGQNADDNSVFNLEEMILAAAFAQGIDLGKKTEEKVEEEFVPDLEEESELLEKPLIVSEKVQTTSEEAKPHQNPIGRLLKSAEQQLLIHIDAENEVQVLDEKTEKEVPATLPASEEMVLTEEQQKIDFAIDIQEEEKVTEPEVSAELDLKEESEQENVPQLGSPRVISRKWELTREERLQLGYFARVPAICEQILSVMSDQRACAFEKTSVVGNIVVMGARESGKTQLISKLIPTICKDLNREAAKVAYIYADQLKGKNIARIVSKMSGGFLVIENINLMDKETVSKLNKAMEFRTDGLTVILEEEKEGMKTFLASYPEFAAKFTSTLKIPVLMNDELIYFAACYLEENGFCVNDMGVSALYNWISENQKPDQPMTIGSVKEKLDQVLRRANAGGFRIFMKKRAEKDGLQVLTEKDFN